MLRRIMERFFRMFQVEGEISDSTIENTPEVAGNESPTDGCSKVGDKK